MNVVENIVKEIKRRGVDTVFGYQGGNITYLVDAIARAEGISYVQTYNEQGAAFAANAYAQVSGNFGVAISSSGPGAINLINGIANAYFDSVPCLFITGNINTSSMKETDEIRQNGFQEADIVSMVKGITKYATTIYDAEQVPEILSYALQTMKHGRPGPVLLDIPHNIQRTEISGRYNENVEEKKSFLDRQQMQWIWEELGKAQRPVILLGNGSRTEQSKALVEKFLANVPMPAVSSLCGKDVISNEHECYLGMIGSYGLPYTNRVLNEADFVLVLGSRMDERQRTVSIKDFLQNAKVIHVDIDESELGHIKKDEIRIKSSVEDFMLEFLDCKDRLLDFSEWLQEVRRWAHELIPEESFVYNSRVRDQVVQILGNYVENSVICVDVGNHQMAAAQCVSVGKGSLYLNSAGLGSMGYALPASIGAYYANPEKQVICIAGDGGIMMNLQELQVISREQLPIAIIILNNQGLGMIEDYQKLAFGGRLHGSRWGYATPNFKAVSEAFGIEYIVAKDLINNNWLEKKRPVFIEIEV